MYRAKQFRESAAREEKGRTNSHPFSRRWRYRVSSWCATGTDPAAFLREAARTAIQTPGAVILPR